jgi:hypothetical protein
MWALPTPLGPSKTTFSARSMNVNCASSWICAFGAPLAIARSNCSSVFTAGMVAMLHQRRALALLTGGGFALEQLLHEVGEVGEACLVARCLLRQRRPVGADRILSHRAEPNLSQGWTPSGGRTSVDKCRALAVC